MTCRIVCTRYVTPGAFIEAAQEFGIPREVAMRNWDGCIQARAALYLPGGRIARELARNPTVLVVNDTAFAHGGLLPTHGEFKLQAILDARMHDSSDISPLCNWQCCMSCMNSLALSAAIAVFSSLCTTYHRDIQLLMSAFLAACYVVLSQSITALSA